MYRATFCQNGKNLVRNNYDDLSDTPLLGIHYLLLKNMSDMLDNILTELKYSEM